MMDENEEFEFRRRYEQEQASAQIQPTTKPVKIGADAFGDTVRGEMLNRDWATRNIIGAGSALTSAWEGIKGLAGQSDPAQVAATKAMAQEAPVGRMAGEVAMLAPTLAIPGAATARGAAAIGAVTGGALTPGDWKERTTAAGLGAAGGAVGSLLSRGANARNAFEPSEAAAAMQREGVSLTPGQNIGGIVRRIEDRLTSAPFVGDIIEKSRIRGIEDFNRAALRRAENPAAGISAQGEIGGQGLQNIRLSANDAYNRVLGGASIDALDPQLVSRLSSLRQGVSHLDQRSQAEFDRLLAREIDTRLAPNGQLSGDNLKNAVAALRDRGDQFRKSQDPFQRDLGDAIKQASAELMDVVRTTNPQLANELRAVDTAYANFKRAQRAGAGVGAERGVFTPSQLHSSVKALDKSKDKRAFSEGTALMQDLSASGREMLPSKIPDSGTAGRLMGSLFNPMAIPGMTAGAMASIPASILYSRGGQEAVNFLVNRGIRPTAESIRQVLAQNPAIAGLATGKLSELAGQ